MVHSLRIWTLNSQEIVFHFEYRSRSLGTKPTSYKPLTTLNIAAPRKVSSVCKNSVSEGIAAVCSDTTHTGPEMPSKHSLHNPRVLESTLTLHPVSNHAFEWNLVRYERWLKLSKKKGHIIQAQASTVIILFKVEKVLYVFQTHKSIVTTPQGT